MIEWKVQFSNVVDVTIKERDLHESSAGSRPAFIPRHPEHVALALDIRAPRVVGNTLAHEHHRFKYAGGIGRLVGEENNPASVAGDHRRGTVHASEQRVLLEEGLLVGHHLHSHVRAAEQLRQILLDPWWRHSFGICAACGEITWN